jgi:hypothetical protein
VAGERSTAGLDAYDREGHVGYRNTLISNAHREIGLEFSPGGYTPYRVGDVVRRRVVDLLKAGNAPDRAGFTAAGRALQKHGSRAGSAFPKAAGNPAVINAQGETILNGIITNPNANTVMRHHARFGDVLEYKVSGGQGARFSSDGKVFIGFIEP